MFMVQLLVKFRFFIQELWERKSLQILYEWTNVDDGRIMRSWRSCLLLYHLLRKPYFSWIITCYYYLLIHLYSYHSSCWYIWIFTEKNYHFILELNINSCLSLIEKTLFHLITIFISFRVSNDPIFPIFHPQILYFSTTLRKKVESSFERKFHINMTNRGYTCTIY